ncbi:MAG: hypothetical protein JWQ83_1393 [Lacunisphaera sp.]|nr:hypothetical protein [Lacunisphaera sp.]
MSQLPPANQPVPGADPSAAPVVEPGFEVTLHDFWQKNRNFVLGLFAAGLLAIVIWKGWEYYAASHEADVQAEFAKLSDQPARLGVFADANAGHPLAGVADLKVADDRFTAGDFAAAATAYTKAAGSLKSEVLLGRAKLGAAISQLNGSDKTAGEAALQAIVADASLAAGVRAEAGYHLASLASEAGKSDEVRKLVEQVSRLDASGPWGQRATMLLSNLPPGGARDAAVAPAPSTGISFKPTTPQKPPGK